MADVLTKEGRRMLYAMYFQAFLDQLPPDQVQRAWQAAVMGSTQLPEDHDAGIAALWLIVNRERGEIPLG